MDTPNFFFFHAFYARAVFTKTADFLYFQFVQLNPAPSLIIKTASLISDVVSVSLDVIGLNFTFNDMFLISSHV